MGIKLIGNSKPIMPFTVEELAERLNDQKAIYDGVSVYLKQRGSQPLDTSMFANAKPAGRLAGHRAGFNTGNYSGKPAAQSAGRFINSQPLKNLKEDGKHYANIAQGNNNAAGRPFVATNQGSFNLSTGTDKNNGAPKASGERQVYNGLKNSEAVFELAARINAERAEREAAKLLEESMKTTTVNSLHAAKIDAPKTFNDLQTIGELNNITAIKNFRAPKAYDGPQDFDMVKEIAASVNAQVADGENNTVVKTPDAPKTLVESKSLNATKTSNAPQNIGERKNLTGTNDINERKGYNGPRDFDIVKEAAARVHAQSNAPKNLAEPMSLSTGTNPKAQAFVPASRALGSNPGLAKPEDFMAHARDFFSNGGLGSVRTGRSTTVRDRRVEREPPARVLLFKDVPDWMTLSDAIGLVYGGAIDIIFRSEMAEITVQFCDEAACKAYLEAYPNGIKVANPGNPTEEVTINVEKATRGQEISPALQLKIGSGGSRLIRIDGMLDAATIQALTVRALEYEVDHVEFRAEKNKTDSAYFFFCGLADGWRFRQKLKQDEDWADYTAEFVVDPCKVATSFHGNTIPNRMASAVAAT